MIAGSVGLLLLAWCDETQAQTSQKMIVISSQVVGSAPVLPANLLVTVSCRDTASAPGESSSSMTLVPGVTQTFTNFLLTPAGVQRRCRIREHALD